MVNFIIKAKTPEDVRKAVVAFFEDELARHDKMQVVLPAKTLRSAAVAASKRKMILANLTFFNEVTIDTNDRTLARYDYTNEAQRSDASRSAQHEYKRLSGNQNVQWRHVDDERGTAYVVELLG